ncbi:MAG TPA: zinc-dependent peptidase [Spirochaetota bacterium]|nr:zinc-dependent peptidase [Spirochaetota bacterium]HPF06577.1 zinc-dependent peptidase [Spirochaetota bacterium]HPJ43281.1 zinc-dependent peptidase [Spirochaetota bacterium]HPR38176.1 zinc-dependent peptidase [Spirochaetota bacterium]
MINRMEIVLTRRYKINFIFSMVISSLAAVFTAFASPYFFNKILPGINYTGITAAVLIFFITHLFITRKYRKRKRIAAAPFPEEWKTILSDLVIFYKQLGDDDKYLFEKKVQIFLDEKIITGIETGVDDSTRLLIASAAVIPVFRISDWEYNSLGEILVYPDRFNSDYSFTDDERNILGMVVSNTSSLIISKKELFKGFSAMDGSNTAIHEFMHKIDEEDGEIDGLPVLMLNSKNIEEWKKARETEIGLIRSGHSDMNPYALSGHAEFLAVSGEYFFESPEKLKKRNPELYRIMRILFNQDPASLIKSETAEIFKRKRKKMQKKRR